jgi:eukaryotic translation initiation factor 2C
MTGPETELNFTVDLDQEKGITPRPGRSNVHRVTIRRTKKLDLGLIDAYLKGKISFDNSVLEGISKSFHVRT